MKLIKYTQLFLIASILLGGVTVALGQGGPPGVLPGGGLPLWELDGNAGTIAGINFLGTTDNEALELKVNNVRALRLEPNGISANVILGKSDNFIAPGVVGSFIAGGGVDVDGNNKPNEIHADYSTIGGGIGNIIANEEAFWSTISGGADNIIGKDAGIGVIYPQRATRNVIAGGKSNVIFRGSRRSIIGGGKDNIVRENTTTSTIFGGFSNEIGPDNKNVVIGGRENLTGEFVMFSIIAGGRNNVIQSNARYATIGGGRLNIATDFYATIPGGLLNEAGFLSFAAGNRAKATHSGSFVWGDASTSADVASSADNQFTARAAGGVRFFSDPGLTTGVELPAGSGSWSTLSDRSVKENIVSVNGRELLERLSEIPIQSWNYRSQDDSIRHIGPMAQDFSAAFGFGPDDRHISTVDADGVALAAIQALHEIAEEQQLELKEQGYELKLRDRKIEGLEERLTYLEELIGKL